MQDITTCCLTPSKNRALVLIASHAPVTVYCKSCPIYQNRGFAMCRSLNLLSFLFFLGRAFFKLRHLTMT